jgi:hypothetical protein
MLGSRCRPQNDALSVAISRCSARAEARCAVVFISGSVVTYRDQQAYPAYLVTFKARPGVSPMQAHVPPTNLVKAVQARIQATMMQARRVAAATVAGSGGSSGARGGGGGGLPKVATCSVAGCSRNAWNGQPGQQCCRTCHISNGGKHGPDCDRKAAGGGGSGPQTPPGRPPHGAPRGGGGGGSGGGGVAGFGYPRLSSPPPPRASSDDDYEEESDEGDVDDEDGDEEGESDEDDDFSRDPWGDEDDGCN